MSDYPRVTMYGPGGTMRPSPAQAPRQVMRVQTGQGVAETDFYRRRAAELEAALEGLKNEPLSLATVIELRGERMTISMGPGGVLDVAALGGARIGDRVLCNRNTMQAMEVIADEIPVGVIISVDRQDGAIVQGENLGTM